AALALGGHYPCLAAHSWSTDATDLAVFGEEAVTTARTDEGASALLALEDGWAYLFLRHGRVRVNACATSDTALVRAVDLVRAGIPAAQAEDRRVPVEFWARAGYGGASYARTIDAPAWSDIETNYPAAARAGIAALVTGPPLESGRLLLWHGPPGTGKTHVVRALGWEWREWCDVHYVADPEEFFGSAQYMLEVLVDEDGDDDRWRLLVLEDTAIGPAVLESEERRCALVGARRRDGLLPEHSKVGRVGAPRMRRETGVVAAERERGVARPPGARQGGPVRHGVVEPCGHSDLEFGHAAPSRTGGAGRDVQGVAWTFGTQGWASCTAFAVVICGWTAATPSTNVTSLRVEAVKASGRVAASAQ
ncbi:MAG TPA: DUF5925 domain-containing protein, partial [Gaiellaceae bacterium]